MNIIATICVGLGTIVFILGLLHFLGFLLWQIFEGRQPTKNEMQPMGTAVVVLTFTFLGLGLLYFVGSGVIHLINLFTSGML